MNELQSAFIKPYHVKNVEDSDVIVESSHKTGLAIK